MTPSEREYFAAGFAYAFALAVGVQRQALAHIDGSLDSVERWRCTARKPTAASARRAPAGAGRVAQR
jgi:hypothetical protein